ncbi:heme NO-binding domain-containing protein [Cellvibrio sp.]
MKGIVFTEFMDMVEQRWGLEMVDDLIDATNPASNGAYTSVGTYDINELVGYVVELSRRLDAPVPALVKAFGVFLAGSFVKKFPIFFASARSTFDVLREVDRHIHVEVRKLYPDAELPVFSYRDVSADTLELIYESTRNLPDLAEGLIEGCAGHFNELLRIERSHVQMEPVPQVVFLITRLA